MHVETLHKQTWGERTYIYHSLKSKLFHRESQAPGEVMVDTHLHKGKLDTIVMSV